MDTSMSSYSEDSYAPDVDPSPGGTGHYDPDWGITQAAARGSVIMVPNKPSIARRGGGRKPKNDKLPPEEEEKRRLRRERNKLAAAKCRQRRVDHANELQQETDVLEGESRRLIGEIERLRQLKEQYEFVLQSHLAVCSRESLVTMTNVKSSVAKGMSTGADMTMLPSLSMLSSGTSSSSVTAGSGQRRQAAGSSDGAGGPSMGPSIPGRLAT